MPIITDRQRMDVDMSCTRMADRQCWSL